VGYGTYLPITTDANRDGVVNVLDRILVAENFGTGRSDMNGEGTTDVLDLTLVAQAFSER